MQGGCSFCSLALHQGHRIRSHSRKSILAEAERLTEHPDWKGSLSNVGGSTANLWAAKCLAPAGGREGGRCVGFRLSVVGVGRRRFRVQVPGSGGSEEDRSGTPVASRSGSRNLEPGTRNLKPGTRPPALHSASHPITENRQPITPRPAATAESLPVAEDVPPLQRGTEGTGGTAPPPSHGCPRSSTCARQAGCGTTWRCWTRATSARWLGNSSAGDSSSPGALLAAGPQADAKAGIRQVRGVPHGLRGGLQGGGQGTIRHPYW